MTVEELATLAESAKCVAYTFEQTKHVVEVCREFVYHVGKDSRLFSTLQLLADHLEDRQDQAFDVLDGLRQLVDETKQPTAEPTPIVAISEAPKRKAVRK